MNEKQGAGYRVQGTDQSAELRAQSSDEAMTGIASGVVQIEAKKPTLADVRAKLANQKGKKFWRSVDELAETPEFAEMVAKEFPSQASEWIDPVSRRNFLKVMGASMALAGLAGAGRFDSRQAGVFCVGVSICVGRGASPGEERFVPADQGRRESGASCGEGWIGPVHAGDAAGFVRSGPVAAHFVSR
jgi:MoCo/4Fe-4S cofactor protein with predicted Tat translocation signal